MEIREIKFRGKRIDNGEWVEGDLITKTPFGECIRSGTDHGYTVDPTTIGQFTGLRDKHGKEIYEGDLLIDGHEDESPKSTPREVYFCEYQSKFMAHRKFESGGAASGELNTWDNYIHKVKELDYYEIIGSIHDKELKE